MEICRDGMEIQSVAEPDNESGDFAGEGEDGVAARIMVVAKGRDGNPADDLAGDDQIDGLRLS